MQLKNKKINQYYNIAISESRTTILVFIGILLVFVSSFLPIFGGLTVEFLDKSKNLVEIKLSKIIFTLSLFLLAFIILTILLYLLSGMYLRRRKPHSLFIYCNSSSGHIMYIFVSLIFGFFINQKGMMNYKIKMFLTMDMEYSYSFFS